jgi:hypothetical protein
MSNPQLLLLLNLLEDEFRDFKDVRDFRIRPLAPSGTRRSIDLVQDYDEEISDLHLKCGVSVRAKGRDYYFPVEWSNHPRPPDFEKQINQIREILV